jgi:uncharacterized protein YjbJ (UPF0337 family)
MRCGENGHQQLYKRSTKLPPEESTMQWDRVEDRWNQIVGAVKARWSQLTDDDLNVIAGKRAQLIGRIQERYEIARDEAQRQVEQWIASLREDEFTSDSLMERKAS